MSEFNSLESISDWSAKLAEMLDEAVAATKAKDDATRLAIAARLRHFVKKSPPLLPGTGSLDNLALDAALRLADSVIKDAVERIKGRTSEFLSLKKQIDTISAKAEADARRVRLEPAREAVDALTAAARAVEDLDAVLMAGSDDELRAKLKAILKAIEVARDALGEIGRKGP